MITRISFFLEDEILTEIDNLAELMPEGITRSYIIRECLNVSFQSFKKKILSDLKETKKARK